MTAGTQGAAMQSELKVAQAEAVKEDIALVAPDEIRAKPGEDKALDEKAEHFVKVLLEMDPKDIGARDARKSAVENMGLELQKRAAQQSEMLKQPVKALSQRSEDGGEVANALINLKVEVEELDPGKFDFEPGWFTRALGQLPGIGTPMKRYFSRYESAQTVIAAIIRALENGREQLKRDNITLTEDQKRMREITHKLEQAIKLGQLIDQKLQYRLERDLASDPERTRFVGEELVFPLRQRLIDLQQQLAVNQQGVLASEIIIRNNKELIRGVDRALNVTVTALQVAATVALALANQKIVLDKVSSVNKTTSDLISGTAARLKTQGVEIHKQASSAQIDMEALKSAFVDINTAMDNITQFRTNALPQMAQTVLELDRITAQAGKAIEKMEQGNRAKPSIAIEVD